jgi:hypothetical protein
MAQLASFARYSLVVLDVLAAILATASVIAAIAGLRWPGRLGTVAGFSGLLAAGVLALALRELHAPGLVLALGLTCLMLGVIIGAGREQRDDRSGSELQRHLARCRRRGENASALVVTMSDPIGKNAMEALRITDSASVRRIGKRWELHAIFDNDDVPRRIVEDRLGRALGNSTPTFGWATFPADGLTLEALFEHARAATRRDVPATAARHADDSWRAPDDPAPAT